MTEAEQFLETYLRLGGAVVIAKTQVWCDGHPATYEVHADPGCVLVARLTAMTPPNQGSWEIEGVGLLSSYNLRVYDGVDEAARVVGRWLHHAFAGSLGPNPPVVLRSRLRSQVRK